jgi:formylmethanofuran dehydrogenase subunit E
MSINKNLEANHSYLIRMTSSSSSLLCITILLVTEKAYQVRWNTNTPATTWELITNFNGMYELYEDITTYMQHYYEPKENEFDYWKIDEAVLNRIDVLKNQIPVFQICPYCCGNGIIDDNTSTAGKKICPYCYGSRYKKL